MSWIPDDTNLLKTLAGIGGEEKQQWRCLSRNGRMLLLIRDGAPRDVLRLYQPQRVVARCVRFLLSMTHSLGGLNFLRPIELAPTEGSPLSRLAEETKGEAQAILLGNPTQEARRAVIILTAEDGSHLVAKTGVNPAARAAVVREHEFINQWSESYSAMQKCSHYLEHEGWAAFVVDFLDGKKVGVEDSNEILDVLKGWISARREQSLSSFSRWHEVVSKWPMPNIKSDVMAAGERIILHPSLAHGDFAPWNIIRDDQEIIKVIDWEAGETDGIPGWDWVHFLYQTATLVQRKTVVQTAAYLKDCLSGDESQKYLHHAGWHGDESWLLKTYLAAEQSNDPDFRGKVLGSICSNG